MYKQHTGKATAVSSHGLVLSVRTIDLVHKLKFHIFAYAYSAKLPFATSCQMITIGVKL